MHSGSVNAREGRRFHLRRPDLRGCRPALGSVVFVLLIGLLVLPTIAAAQGVGGVSGTIRNGETGERLDYANVVLTRTSDGAQFGAMSLGGGPGQRDA